MDKWWCELWQDDEYDIVLTLIDFVDNDESAKKKKEDWNMSVKCMDWNWI